MSDFPKQLPWRRFVRVLQNLGYCPLRPHRGSIRWFSNPSRHPNIVSFHEPHPGDNLHEATLHGCLRMVRLSTDEFMELLKHC